MMNALSHRLLPRVVYDKCPALPPLLPSVKYECT